MYPKVQELYSKIKTYLRHKNHWGASVPLGMVAIAIILSAGLIFQVKVLQQQTQTVSQADEPVLFQAVPSLDNGLVSYWNFDESSGNIAADIKNTNNGTVTGTTIVDGKFGKTRNFNGSSDGINLPANSSMSDVSNITISAWVNPEIISNVSQTIIDRTVPQAGHFGEWGLHISRNHLPAIWIGRGDEQTLPSCEGTTLMNPHSWYHITASHDGTNIKIYVNGKLENTCPGRLGLSSQILPATIGVTSVPVTTGQNPIYYRFQGVIDEMGVWNRALTGEEILSLANGARPGIPEITPNPTTNPNQPMTLKSGLSAYWRFDESTGTTFKDEISGNTASGNVGAKEGKVGWARDFQPIVATAGQLETPIQPELTVAEKSNFNLQQFSFNAWIFPRSYRAWASIFNHRGVDNKGISFELHNSTPESAGLMQCAVSATSVATTYRLPLNQWSMVTCTVTQNKQLTVYVNGVQSATTTFATDIPYSANPVTKIGKNIVSGEVFDGIIDEVGVWNRGITAQEITALYGGGNALNFSQFESISSGPPPAPTVQAAFDCVNQNQVGEYVFHVTWPAAITGITAVQIASQPGFGGDVYTSRSMTLNGNTYMVKGPGGFGHNGTDLKSTFKVGQLYYVRIFKGDSLPGPVTSFLIPSCGANSQ